MSPNRLFFQPPKTVPGHGHRNRHIDAHHAHLHAAAEFARHVAVAGEAGYAVAELVVVDELQRLGEVGHAHAGQHGAEDFFLVDSHLGGHVVKQRAAEPEAIAAALSGLVAVKATAIGQQRGAFLHTEVDVAADTVCARPG